MPYFVYVYCVYFNEIDEIPKSYHQSFIHHNKPNITIITPGNILKRSLIQFPVMFSKTILFLGYKKMFMLL